MKLLILIFIIFLIHVIFANILIINLTNAQIIRESIEIFISAYLSTAGIHLINNYPKFDRDLQGVKNFLINLDNKIINFESDKKN